MTKTKWFSFFKKIVATIGILLIVFFLWYVAQLTFLMFFGITIILTIVGVSGISNEQYHQTEFYIQISNQDSNLYEVIWLFAPGLLILIIYFLFHKKEPEIIPFEKKNLWKKYSKGLLAGALAGFLIMGTGYLFGIYHIKWVYDSKNFWLLLGLFIGNIVSGISHSVIFQGFVQTKLSKIWSSTWGLLISSLFFACVADTPLEFINAVLLALSLGFIHQQTDSLWFIGGYYTSWNLLPRTILGFDSSQAMIFKSSPRTYISQFVSPQLGMKIFLIAIFVHLAQLIYVYHLRNKPNFWLDN